MDLALIYNPARNEFDLAVDGADLAAEDTLISAMLVSLFCDRLVQDYEVGQGEDLRGWWADSLTDGRQLTGSRLWLLERAKQLINVIKQAEQYCEEALAWMMEDGIVSAVTVTAFAMRPSLLAALIHLTVNGKSRRFRFEFDQERQIVRFTDEVL
jgi:phage gp46-like protein